MGRLSVSVSDDAEAMIRRLAAEGDGNVSQWVEAACRMRWRAESGAVAEQESSFEGLTEWADRVYGAADFVDATGSPAAAA